MFHFYTAVKLLKGGPAGHNKSTWTGREKWKEDLGITMIWL